MLLRVKNTIRVGSWVASRDAPAVRAIAEPQPPDLTIASRVDRRIGGKQARAGTRADAPLRRARRRVDRQYGAIEGRNVEQSVYMWHRAGYGSGEGYVGRRGRKRRNPWLERRIGRRRWAP